MLADRSGRNTFSIIQLITHSNTNDSFLFNQLFLYIKNNKRIRNFLETIPLDTEKNDKAHQLLSAIKLGNSTDKIYNDEECYLFILYLIKEKHIPFWDGITIYFYWMGVIQFANRQKISIINMSENGEFTVEGLMYLERLQKDLLIQNITVSNDELKTLIFDLSPSEQWIIKIPFHSHWVEESHLPQSSFSILIDQICHTYSKVPFIQSIEMNGERSAYISSFSIINFVLKKTSRYPVNPQIVYGSVGLLTLIKSHTNGEHPVTIYGHLVKSNMTKVHGMAWGPLGIALHDLAHVYWGSLLPLEFRETIFNFLIPNLRELQNLAKEFNDNGIIIFLGKIINMWADLDLLKNYCDPIDKRYDNYLKNGLYYGLGSDECFTVNIKLGSLICKLYFLSQCHYFKKAEWGNIEQTTWNNKLIKLLEKLTDQTNKSIPAYIITALTALAKRANGIVDNTEYKMKPVNWVGWLELLNTAQNNDNLWKKIQDDEKYKEELITLIAIYKLDYYHPYLPMTEDRKLKFRVFLEEKIRQENTESCQPVEQFTNILKNQ